MKYSELLSKAEKHLDENNFPVGQTNVSNSFSQGAFWMFQRLKELDSSKQIIFNASLPYTFYGIIKYSICLIALLSSAFFILQWNIYFLPLSIIVFYLFEIHFLFLFPIIIDSVENPVRTSIKAAYKIGMVEALITIIPIGIYMMTGLLNFKSPLRHWYIGCMAVLIWYQNEVRDRI